MKTLLFFLTILFFSFNSCLGQKASNLVISQVYGGGGNTSATYQNDFIELFNPTALSINLSGWSVQYASAAGSSWNVINLSGSVSPGAYYLIKLASSGSVGNIVSQYDLTGTINISASTGKIALCDSLTTLSGDCPKNIFIKDFVGYGSAANCFEGAGATPGPNNNSGISRINDGCTDANNNATDFTTGITPWRYSGSAPNNCSLGITKTDEENIAFNIRPNPAINRINVFYFGSLALTTLELYNLTGSRVYQTRISEMNTEIDISTLIKGFYFYKFNDSFGLIQTGKLIIE